MFKKIFFSLLIFLVMGELMFRLDNTFQFFSAERIVKIKTGIQDTPEYEMVKNNSINTNGNNFRIMVLGDSYIYGGGIDAKNNFSHQLILLLQKANTKFDSLYVLDISKPMANCLDYNELYFEYASKFKPDIVIIGYCYNDIDDNLDKSKSDSSKIEEAGKNIIPPANPGFKQKMLSLLTSSVLLQRTIHNSIFELKALGYIVPNSQFDNTLKSYYLDKDNWVKSKSLLKAVFDDAKQKGTQFIFLQFPEINLLDYPAIFTKTDSSIKQFVAGNTNVKYIYSPNILKGEKATAYLLSRYDGHPNDKAHKRIADSVFTVIKDMDISSGAFK